MISLKIGGFIVAAFVVGAFLASPELRAYAANTIGSADIINNSILSADIKDGEVKAVDLGGSAVTSAKIKDNDVKAVDIAQDAVGASEIAANAVGVSELTDNAVDSFSIADGAVGRSEIGTDAVGPDEIDGVTRLLFAECFASGNTIIPSHGGVAVNCFVGGATGGNVIVTNNNPVSCFVASSAFLSSINNVQVTLTNICASGVSLGPSIKMSLIVFAL